MRWRNCWTRSRIGRNAGSRSLGSGRAATLRTACGEGPASRSKRTPAGRELGQTAHRRRARRRPLRGCGEALNGREAQRFVSEAHRVRAHRAKRARRRAGQGRGRRRRPSCGSPSACQRLDGRTRAGLEVWIARQDVELPEMLVEARSLADEVDLAPGASPLWGGTSTPCASCTNRRCR
jgi:hypothetical protein